MRLSPQNFFSKTKHFVVKHKIWTACLVIVALVLFFVAKPKAAPTIPTQRISNADIKQLVSASGTVAVTRSANLTFQIAGKVVYIGAKKGDTVKQYQIIAQLDQRTIQQNIQNAVDAYNSQKISYDIVNDFNGDRTLADTGLSVSARRQLETALNSLDQTQIALTIQRLAQEQSYIAAPFDGILTRADIQNPGVAATATTTYTVVDPNSVVFDIDVDEADISQVKVGQPIAVSLDAYPDKTFHLTVEKIDFVSHTTSTGGTAYTVEAALPANNDYAYRVGMNGNGDILIQERKHVVSLPLVALFNDNHVYVQQGKYYVDKTVKLGLQNDTDSEVVSGLQPGDIVALQPDLVTKYKLNKAQ